MANTYGMLGGAGADSTYSGSYNITPTTSDITLATKNTGLEGDMTIQGDSDLVAGNINYGKSMFGVDGSYLALNMGQGEGTAYVSGVASEGDVIRSVSDSYNVKTIVGEMPSVSNKYTYYTYNATSEHILSQHRNRYITISSSASSYINNPIFRVYEGQVLVSEIDLNNIFNGQFCRVNPIVNILTGDVFMTFTIYGNNVVLTSGIFKIRIDGSYRYKESNIIDATNKLVISYRILNYIFIVDSVRLQILNEYLDYSYNSPITFDRTLNFSLEETGHRCIFGKDGFYYIFNNGIQGSGISGNYDDFIKVNDSGTVITSRSLKQTDLNFGGGTKSSDSYCSNLALGVDAASNVYLYYSNQINDSPSTDKNTSTFLAIFNENMVSKTSDVSLSPLPSIGLGNESLSSGFYYYVGTDTMLIYSEMGYIRIDGFSNSILAYICDYFTYSSYPCVLDSGEIDYTITNNAKSGGYFYSTYTYEDRSVLFTKTITTDTYTAELEEV